MDGADANLANVRLLEHCVDVEAYNAYFMENLKILNQIKPSPASTARSDKQWVGTCLYHK